MAEAPRSSHPVDALIRELIRARRDATTREIEEIIERVATAPFNPGRERVPTAERGLVYRGRIIRRDEDSLFRHLVKRVLLDRQWPVGTTEDQYLADLRGAVRASSVRLAVYQRRDGCMAATLAHTDEAMLPVQRGAAWLPELLVVYSADRGMLISGYQVSGLETTGVPKGARWLK